MSLSEERLTDAQFRSIAQVVQTRVGIQLPQAKRIMLEGRLRKRLRALNMESYEEYCAYLFDEGRLTDEFVHLVDCVTTNKTDFFREPAHFDFLRDEAVPQLCARGGSAARRIKLWSAAASTGAEAYTAAMVLEDMVGRGAPFAYAILGTDVSTEVLATAEAGIYPAEMLAPVPPDFRRRYVLEARDPARREMRIAPELRQRVRFQHLNLMSERYPVDGDVDIILCRNVLIYFDKPTQAAVLGRLAQHLSPGGYLIVGHSESMAGTALTGLRQVSSTIFRR
ncbi:CheR family methyltransferase [Methylobacterium sp. JK268]